MSLVSLPRLFDSHLAVSLSFDLALIVAACANRAVRRGNALDELVSTQLGTSRVLLTKAECYCTIRVRAAHNTRCSTTKQPTALPQRINIARSCSLTMRRCSVFNDIPHGVHAPFPSGGASHQVGSGHSCQSCYNRTLVFRSADDMDR